MADHDLLRTQILDEYARHRHPALAQRELELERSVEAQRLELPPKSGRAAEWLASLLDPASTDVVSALRRGAVLEALARLAKEAPASTVTEVVKLLADLPADPRVAEVVMRLLTEPRAVREMSERLFAALVRAVEHHGHPGFVAPLEAFAAKYTLADDGPAPEVDDRWLWRGSGKVKKVAAKLSKLRSTPDPALLAPALDTPAPLTRAEPTPPAAHGDDLLAAIAANPDDDRFRSVLADALTERGDPRGELLLLQLKRAGGQSTKASVAKEKAILAEHRMALMGPLRDAFRLSGLEFRRGFLASGVLKGPLPECIEAAMLEAVDFESLEFDLPPSLKNLREARGVRFGLLARLAAQNPRLARVHATWVDLSSPVVWPIERELASVELQLIHWSTETQAVLANTLPRVAARSVAISSSTRPVGLDRLLPTLHPAVESFEVHLGRFQTTAVSGRERGWANVAITVNPLRFEAAELDSMLNVVDGWPPFTTATVECHPDIETLVTEAVRRRPALAAATVSTKR